MKRALRVLADARPLDIEYLRTQGIGRYVSELLPPLAAAAAARGHELVLLRDRARGEAVYGGSGGTGIETVEAARPAFGTRLSELPEQLLLPRDVRRARAAVYHAMSIYRTAPPRVAAGVTTVHDVIPLLFPDLYLKTGLMHRLLYRAARAATEVITVSEAAKHDIVARLGIPAARVSVATHGVDARFRPSPSPEMAARIGVEGPYLLYVGGLANPDPRKNVETLIDAFASWSRDRERDETLVLCGRLGDGGRPLVQRAERSGARIAFTGFFPDEDLPALLTEARCLVTATRYEGFGLPALEAVACGTPVIAFDTGAVPEAAGPGALLAPLDDGVALMSAVERVCDEPGLRARLAAAGREHAAQFTWERCADAHWDVYERAAGRR